MNVKYFAGQLTASSVFTAEVHSQDPSILPRTALQPQHLGTVVKNQYPDFHFRFVACRNLYDHGSALMSDEEEGAQYHAFCFFVLN